MRLLLATNHLWLGGTESYLLTVAEQFERLGHEVTIYAPEVGAGEAVARERDLEVVSENGSIPADLDAALVQDGAVSAEVAARCPDVPQVFVVHSTMFALQDPPQLDEAVGVVVVLNDRVAARMRSFATPVEVVRMRQPIDTNRFVPREALPEVPRRALLLSNYSLPDRLETIESACSVAGVELHRLGAAAGSATDVRPALAEADIVMGYGRSALEGMACGRAVYVYDMHGGDGWMTAESYAQIEADGLGFAGSTGELVLDRDTLVEDLHHYSASMGPINHDLVMAHHHAGRHAEELTGLLSGLANRPPRPRESAREMARLVRLEWRAQLDVHALRSENAELSGRLRESEVARINEVEEREAEFAEAARRLEADVRLEYERSLSWQITAPVRALLRRLRGSK
ncbi:MAG TPA: hypothetical protein VK471_02600 [Solirubrobacterales bacterium]|nr:hypothetical protein [Solirubrobacterales bacterium]